VPVDVAARTVRDPVPAEASVDAIAFKPNGSELLTAEHGANLREFLVLRDAVTLEPNGPKDPHARPGSCDVPSDQPRRFPCSRWRSGQMGRS
jgi:hypothetical protein